MKSINHRRTVQSSIAFAIATSLCACSTNDKTRTSFAPTSENSISTIAHCAYRHIKGIAELTAIKEHQLEFQFIPGDTIFTLNKESLPKYVSPHIGMEIKATASILIKGSSETCVLEEPRLVFKSNES